MITKPMDVLTCYEVRKSTKQKTAFITAVTAYVTALRYSCKVEKGSLGSRNIIIGDPAKAKYLITAHYDTPPMMLFPNFITPCNIFIYLLYQIVFTVCIIFFALVIGYTTAQLINPDLCIPLSAVYAYILLFLMLIGPANQHTANDNTSGVVTLLEIAATMPENLRDRVCFILFDLEEVGLIGSSSYRKTHKTETERQIILNLDCVGDGDHIVLFPSKKVMSEPDYIARLQVANCRTNRKRIYVHKKEIAFYPSDQMNFPYSVGIGAFKKAKFLGLYCDRIHTYRDTILDQTNVNILRAALISVIGSAVK